MYKSLNLTLLLKLMMFDPLTPPQGHRGRGQIYFAIAHPINVSNSHTKFGIGLAVDSIMVRDGI